MPRRHLAAGYRWWLSHACLRALGQRLIGRVGWQSALIVAAAPIWVVYGVAILTGDAAEPAGAPHLVIPGTARAAGWIASGALAVAQAWRPAWRPTAVVGLWIMPMLRVGSYAVLFLGALLPWAPDIYPGEAPLDESGAIYWKKASLV